MKLKNYSYLTYEELKRRDPIWHFSQRYKLTDIQIKELYRMCETDFRFRKGIGNRKYIGYEKVSELIFQTWGKNLGRREIKYIHNVIRLHEKYSLLLKRGGKIAGTYRDLVLRKS